MNRGGYLIVYVMIITFVVMSMGLTVLATAGAQYTFIKGDSDRENAAYAAKACARAAVDAIKANPATTGFDKTIFDGLNDQGGKATCKTVVTTAGSQKKVAITAKVLRYSGDSQPITYNATAVVGFAGSGNTDYWKNGVLIGNGGAIIPASGSVTTSQLNVAGPLLVGYKSVSSVGTSAKPITQVNVANTGCGSSDWPQPCSTEPIRGWYPSISSPVPATIYSTNKVCAPGQTNTSMLDAGLDTSCARPNIQMPIFDKKSFVSSMTSSISAATVLSGCVNKVPIIPSYPAYGYYYYGQDYHVPANTKITGTLDFASLPSFKSGTCNIIFDGNAYITGGMTRPTQSAQIAIKSGLTSDITLVVNGQISITQNAVLKPNDKGAIMHIIDFYSSDSTCSNSDIVPSATQASCLSTANAKASAGLTFAGGTNQVAYPALLVTTGSYSTGDPLDLSGATLYAYYGGVSFGLSDVTIAALAAQALGDNDSSNSGFFLGLTTTRSDDVGFGTMVPMASYDLVDYYRN